MRSDPDVSLGTRKLFREQSSSTALAVPLGTAAAGTRPQPAAKAAGRRRWDPPPPPDEEAAHLEGPQPGASEGAGLSNNDRKRR